MRWDESCIDDTTAGAGRRARRLTPNWCVVALDQRGHGHSDQPSDFSRDGYVADAAAVRRHLGSGPAVAVAHCPGGVKAHWFAARRPRLVRALVIAFGRWPCGFVPPRVPPSPPRPPFQDAPAGGVSGLPSRRRSGPSDPAWRHVPPETRSPPCLGRPHWPAPHCPLADSASAVSVRSVGGVGLQRPST
ncbi:alpha/beta fold hydrolase [Streptomyces sp. NPDC055815]